MKRRSLIFAAGASAVLTAARAHAQSPATPRRIGWLSTAKPDSPWTRDGFEAFSKKLKDIGYVEGRDLVFERRWAGGAVKTLPEIARNLLALKPALVIAESSPATAALQKETSSVPIVFANIGEPVEQGFVASLARPGANITGTTFRFELMRKLPELVRDTLPEARRIALLEDERFKVSKRVSMRFGEAASALGYKLDIVPAGSGEFERAFAELTRLRTQVLLLPPQYVGQAGKLSELAMRAKLPAFGNYREYAEAGALLSNYSDRSEGFQRVAVMADKILKGAKPADLPVEEPERMYLAVNLRTARALGIKVPQSVLVRADEVID